MNLLDSAFYDSMAKAILAGGPQLEQPFLMAPLYGYFLAAIYAVQGLLGWEGPGLVFGLQALLGAATAGLTALLGGRLGGRVGAAVAGLLGALYPVAVLYDAKLLSVTLSTFLATLGALGAAALWDRLRAGRAAGALALGVGLALGLATEARGNLLISLPPLLLLLAWAGRGARSGRWAVALFALGLALPLGLAWAHNARAGSPALVSVNGGVNLYRGNNPWFVDEAVEPFRLPAERDALAKRSQLIASIASDRPLSPRESDAYWTGRALDHWQADPLRYGALFLRKTVQVLGWEEISDNIDHEHLLRESRALGWIPPLYGPMVALGLVGLALRLRQGRLREDAPLLLLLVTGVASVALFFVVARYRLPLVPLWAALAGAAAAEGLARWRAGARGAVARGGIAAALLAALLARSPTSAIFPWNWLAPPQERPACLLDPHVLRAPEVEDAYRLAFDALMQGRAEEAERRLREVVARDPEHAPAGVTLSYLLLERGDAAGAAVEAARVAKLDPCEEKAWFNLGSALLLEGRYQAALGALHKTVELDPYDPASHTALGQAWLALGNRAEAREALAFSVRWDEGDWKARALLARVALKESKPNEAAKLLDEALLLAPDQADLWAIRGLAALGLGDLDGAEAALLQGEATERAHPERPRDPILAALRRAIDQPFRMPEKMELVAKPRPGIGP